MNRFAIDVVILPPDTVMDLSMEYNRMLLKSRQSEFILDKTSHLPHITLVMGCLAADQLEHANVILQSIASNHRILELHVPHIRTVKTASGNSVVSFDIKISRELAALHESIVTAFRPLLTQDANDANINDQPPIEASTLEWINHFIPHYCFDNFWPHITLGFGEPPGTFNPYSFQGSRLAICHLGNHCMCRRILGEVILRA